MDPRTTTDISWQQTRRDSTRQRRGPKPGSRVTVAYSSDGKIPSVAMSTLLIEATDHAGEVANWLDDAWWSRLFRQCASDPLTIEIAPTHGALLHPVVLHQLEMVRRIVANWRVIGEGYAGDFRTEDEIVQLVTGPYHELRLHDGGHPDTIDCDPPEFVMGVDDLIKLLRSQIDGTPFASPTLVRLPRRDS